MRAARARSIATRRRSRGVRNAATGGWISSAFSLGPAQRADSFEPRRLVCLEPLILRKQLVRATKVRLRFLDLIEREMTFAQLFADVSIGLERVQNFQRFIQPPHRTQRF